MKKLILILGIATSGILCAASPTKSNVKSAETINAAQNNIKKISFNGFIAYDTTCCGTCYQYGTYTEQTVGGITYWEFESASQATSSTVITPPCTGAGSYMG
ncbi:hypothetical protein ACNFU2_03885 [Chryseobacterium sp. PTM-20240506]|uniref:hypothetical protein n=1 Tax=Chryseobacterium sp. PTM-20240506 TaxID=3400631 RepID=UPI003AAC4E68